MRYPASLAEEVVGVMGATVPLGMPSGKTGHHPGWKPLQGSATIMSQARLHARAGSLNPQVIPRGEKTGNLRGVGVCFFRDRASRGGPLFSRRNSLAVRSAATLRRLSNRQTQ